VRHVNWPFRSEKGRILELHCDVQQSLFLGYNVGLARGGVDGVDVTLVKRIL
jgi:hypothetical protein